MYLNWRLCRVLTLVAAGGVLVYAQAESELSPDLAMTTGTSYALFQNATITSAGNTVMATRVPLVTSTGSVLYYDVTLLFVPGATGGLTLASGYPKVTQSKTLITSAFQPGTYVGPSTVYAGGMKISVAGPGVGPGGSTQWSLNATNGANACTFPTSATWYVTSSLANSPIAARLKAAGITSTVYSYGIVGYDECGVDDTWGVDSLIGVSQTGNKLTIVNFTRSGQKDSNTPVDQITYTLSAGS